MRYAAIVTSGPTFKHNLGQQSGRSALRRKGGRVIRNHERFDALIDSVRQFVRQRLVPIEAQVAEQDCVPPDVVQGMRDLGLFGISIPEQYGGLGLSMEEEVHVIFEMGATSPAFRSVFGTNVGVGSQGLLMEGTAQQKERYLPGMASGRIIGAFALTEAEAGSDAGRLKTVARRDGLGYVLDGTKCLVTNAPTAGIFTVFARTDPSTDDARGVSAFLVEAGTPGMTIGPPRKKMGQQGTQVSDVIFENCHVPLTALIGGREGRGFAMAMGVLGRTRLHIAALAVGVAERLVRMMVQQASERRQFRRPIGDFQLIQAMLADSYTEAYAGRSMVLDAARRLDAGSDVSMDSAACKYFATEAVGRIADRAVQVHGGVGYLSGNAVERLYRDVRVLRIYEGTSQIQQIIIAKRLLRNRASRAVD